MVGPTGVENKIAATMPITAQTTEITAEQRTTARNERNTLMAQRAGKIMRAEIKSEPTRFIAMTIMIAVTMAMSRL